MTRDDVIRLAREAEIGDSHGYIIQNELAHLERFAALVIKEHTQQVKETPVHKIDGADWPEPDSGFAKLEAL